jgi:ribose transport system ATP-binding protein
MKNYIKEVRLVDLSKRFLGIDALKPLSLTLDAPQVVGLVGENGAGKSTLIKILSGAIPPSSGHITINGHETALKTPRAAARAGIRTIYQELTLCPHLSVAENILLGNEPRHSEAIKSFFIDRKKLKLQAREILDRLVVTLPLDRPVELLTIAEQQLVEICKALAGDASFLIMDEPTSSLSAREVTTLLDLVTRLKGQGRLVLFVSHRLDEVLSVADRIIVLRDGQLVADLKRGQAGRQTIIHFMLGRNLDSGVRRPISRRSESLLGIKDLVTAPGKPPISFVLTAGEILCLAGLVGAGRSAILHSIFHSKRAVAGEVTLRGQPLGAMHPQKVVRRGIGFVPEDRKLQGIILNMSVGKNITLPALRFLTKFGVINRRKEFRRISEAIGKYMIKVSDPATAVGALSGGNQQKVVLAKWLSMRPQVLLVDEPTRGVDVAGKAEIHDLLQRMADSGIGILMVSSEIEEVLQVATRVLVISGGRVVRQLAGDEITESNILESALPAY